ncbi:MAG TPA: hypothetical protein VG603_12465, partial [Chitinophagales bacterium]|nr:hypothetical protein [Chitinophagales bacterium]
TNGSYLLGVFRDGSLLTGISMWKDNNGEVFFGAYVDGQRTGYGELRSSNGNCYYGEFKNGRLIRGFAKEIDQFGYATYARIESGVKKLVEPAQVASFFTGPVFAKK